MPWGTKVRTQSLKFRKMCFFSFSKRGKVLRFGTKREEFSGVFVMCVKVGVVFSRIFWNQDLFRTRYCMYIMQIYRYHFMGQIFQNMGHLGYRYIYILFSSEAQKKPVFDPSSRLSWILTSNIFSRTQRDDGILCLLSVGPEPIVGSM